MTRSEIKHRLDELKEELDNLADEMAQIEAEEAERAEIKPWRAEKNVGYCCVRDIGEIYSTPETGGESDCDRYKIGNYYRTRALAEQDAKELALRGRVRQLRDALCEGYQFIPDGDNFHVYFDTSEKYFFIGCFGYHKYIGEIYFDTREHAQQACDILNAELTKEE